MPNGCINHANILDENDKLTIIAKKKFIDDVLTELYAGTPSTALQCGTPLQPNENAQQVDLSDEKKFPEFHKTYFPCMKILQYHLIQKEELLLLQ